MHVLFSAWIEEWSVQSTKCWLLGSLSVEAAGPSVPMLRGGKISFALYHLVCCLLGFTEQICFKFKHRSDGALVLTVQMWQPCDTFDFYVTRWLVRRFWFMKWQVSFLPPQGNYRLIMFLYSICIKIERSPHRNVAYHYIEWLHSSGKYLYSYLPPHTPTKKRSKYVYLSEIKLNWRIREAILQHTTCWAYIAELRGTASSRCHGHER